MPLIRYLLVLVILVYRRFFSGRLSNVRCTFAADETCSLYGLRIARTSRSGREAIARIARRLRRCGDACLVSDGKTLGWRAMHDRSPGEIADAMRADGEGDAAIERMLQARLAVARWCGDRASAAAVQALSHRAVFERPRVLAIAAVSETRLRRYRFALHSHACASPSSSVSQRVAEAA